MTGSAGDAYAVSQKSGTKPSNVEGDDDDEKYMMIDQTEGAGDYAVADPDDGQIYNAYKTLNPIEEAPSHTVNNEQTRIPHLNGEFSILRDT